jgi:hypothetical protein
VRLSYGQLRTRMTEGIYSTKSRSNGYYAERSLRKTRSFIVRYVYMVRIHALSGAWAWAGRTQDVRVIMYGVLRIHQCVENEAEMSTVPGASHHRSEGRPFGLLRVAAACRAREKSSRPQPKRRARRETRRCMFWIAV